MSQFYAIKTATALQPMTAVDAEAFAKIKTGQTVLIEVRQPRNSGHHRKYFSLMNFAYENWEPDLATFHGKPVGKNLNVFRGWITAMAGFYDLGITPDGKVKADPMSISFAAMDQETFEDLYSKTIDVILKHVLKNYKDRAELERVLETVVGYI